MTEDAAGMTRPPADLIAAPDGRADASHPPASGRPARCNANRPAAAPRGLPAAA